MHGLEAGLSRHELTQILRALQLTSLCNCLHQLCPDFGAWAGTRRPAGSPGAECGRSQAQLPPALGAGHYPPLAVRHAHGCVCCSDVAGTEDMPAVEIPAGQPACCQRERIRHATCRGATQVAQSLYADSSTAGQQSPDCLLHDRVKAGSS